MQESALFVEVEAAERLVGHWRRRYDPVAGRGVPAHVTALYPFREPATLGPQQLNALAQLAAGIERHSYALAAVNEFPGVLYLQPTPDEWFRLLTRQLYAAFPDCPPYGGRIDDPQPHLTVGQFGDDADQQRVRQAFAAEVGATLPLQCTASALSLFVSDSMGNWSVAARFPFS